MWICDPSRKEKVAFLPFSLAIFGKRNIIKRIIHSVEGKRNEV